MKKAVNGLCGSPLFYCADLEKASIEGEFELKGYDLEKNVPL
ncbi:hypothetical protein ACOJQI_13630 [Bacillus salacetis]